MNHADRNAAIVRCGYDALNATDPSALADLFDEDASWHTPGRSSIAGGAHGRDAVLAQLSRYVAETNGTFVAALDQVFTSIDGRVVGLHHTSGERNGRLLDSDCCIVFVVENDRIASGREHFFDLDNWDRFWS